MESISKQNADTIVLRWQFVGLSPSKAHQVQQKRGCLVLALKQIIQLSCSISSRWLSLSFNGEVLMDDATVPACQHPGDVVLCSLILPIYARLSAEPCIPRRLRSRVGNQPAVALLAWMPGLISHEWDEDGGDLPASPFSSKCPAHGALDSNPTCNGCRRFVVYVEGLPRLPSRFLRLDLGAPMPTVGRLNERLFEVTGLDAAGLLRRADGGPPLEGARRYLHRLRVLPGDVLTWIDPAGGSEEHGGLPAPPASEEEDDEAQARRLRRRTGGSPAPPGRAVQCPSDGRNGALLWPGRPR